MVNPHQRSYSKFNLFIDFSYVDIWRKNCGSALYCDAYRRHLLSGVNYFLILKPSYWKNARFKSLPNSQPIGFIPWFYLQLSLLHWGRPRNLVNISHKKSWCKNENKTCNLTVVRRPSVLLSCQCSKDFQNDFDCKTEIQIEPLNS